MSRYMGKSYNLMTDEELYALLSEKDKVKARMGFDELYSRYSKKIYAYVRKILNNQEVAEDIYQETFTRFYESAQIKREMTNVAGYLIRIARNLCINEKVRKYNDKVPLDEFQMPVYDRNYSNKQLVEILDMALEALPEKYREVIVLKEYMDMTYNDIADVLGTTLPVVRIRIYRAKNKMRELLAPYIEELNQS